MFSVIFEVHPGAGRKDAYLALAAEMKPVLESIDGFLDVERFASRRRPGWILSLSTWRDEKAVIRWRTEARHHLTQAKGRNDIFADYLLRVGAVAADTAPPAGLGLDGQRFDLTETGTAKAATVTELVPEPGVQIPSEADAVIARLGLDPWAADLVDHDVFESITRPGKVLMLGSWTGPAEADAFRPAAIAGVAMRHRMVRVIRSYGLFDRRETPQYHPPVPRRAVG